MEKLRRIGKYLYGTLDLPLILSAKFADGIGKTMDETQLYAYIDASHGVHHDGKSHAGYSLTMGRGTVDASSGKLPFVTKSSAESELVAVSEKASTIISCVVLVIDCILIIV